MRLLYSSKWTMWVFESTVNSCMATKRKTGSLWLLKDMETPYRHAHPAAFFFPPGGLVVEGAEFRLIPGPRRRRRRGRRKKKKLAITCHNTVLLAYHGATVLSFPPTTNGRLMRRRGTHAPPLACLLWPHPFTISQSAAQHRDIRASEPIRFGVGRFGG